MNRRELESQIQAAEFDYQYAKNRATLRGDMNSTRRERAAKNRLYELQQLRGDIPQ